MQYRSEIDGLRAIAIIQVILFHSGVSVFSGGYVGVDIFFVISGYLITRIVADEIKEGSFTFVSFYAKRARRILPALFFMILIVTALCFIVLLPADLFKYGKMLVFTTVFGANFRLSAQRGYFDGEMRENPLLHMWSLSVEEQFYFVWPMLLLLILQTQRRRRLFVPALLFASFAVSVALTQWLPRSAFYHLPSRGWELLVGASLALGLVPRPDSLRAAQTMSWAGLVMMLCPLFLFDRQTPFPGFAALLPTLGCALVIHATASHRTPVARILSCQPFVFTGKISYSLYLWHWPLIALASYLLLREAAPWESAIAIALSVAIAIFSWRFVEQPFRRPSFRPAPQRAEAPLRIADSVAFQMRSLNRSAYGGFALAVLFVACGTYIQQSKGAGWRLSPEALAAAAQRREYLLHTVCGSYQKSRSDLYECDWGAHRGSRLPVIVWGDSHADHYLPALVKTFHAGKLFMTPSCPPAVLLNITPNFTANIRNCSDNNIEVLKRILAEPPEVVVLGAAWIGSASKPASVAELKTFIQNLTAELYRAGSKVLILGQVPIQPQTRCEALHVHLGIEYTDCGRIERAEFDHLNRPIVQALTSAESKNVLYYSPMDVFCDKVYCYASKYGKLLYSDGYHLNAEGGLLTAQTIKTAILALNAGERDSEGPRSHRNRVKKAVTFTANAESIANH